MKKYKVYFEIFDKKMVTEVTAYSEEEARRKVQEKIVFHAIKQIGLSESEKKLYSIFDDFLKKI